jgi:hypothetical protein
MGRVFFTSYSPVTLPRECLFLRDHPVHITSRDDTGTNLIVHSHAGLFRPIFPELQPRPHQC